MKKITFIAVLLALIWQANAQQQRQDISFTNRHELKLCPAHLIGGSIRIDYEFLLNDWSSVGASGLYSFSRIFSGYGSWTRGQVLGLYRLYFGRQPVSGFFLEGNFGVTMGSYYGWEFWSTRERIDYTAFGLGMALGWKWYIERSGIVLDLFVCGGRLFNDSEGPGAFPRAGITVGRRF